MALPTLTGVGRLTEDPSLRFTPQGKAVAKVRLAFSSRKKDPNSGDWVDGDQYFVDGTVWEQEAEHVAESLQRGVEVLVTGRLKQRQYEKDGQTRTAYDLMIDSIGPTLRTATAKVQKMYRSSGGAAPSGGGADDPWATGAMGVDQRAQAADTDDPPF